MNAGKAYYFLEGGDSQYKIISSQRLAESVNKSKFISIHEEISQDSDLERTKLYDWAYWGTNNDLPNKIVEAVADNAVAMGLLEFRADMDFGLGPFLYKIVGFDAQKNEIQEPIQNPEIEDFMEMNDANNYFLESFDDYEYFGNAFSELRKNKGGKIGFIDHLDASMCRTGNQLNRLKTVNNFFFYHDWRNVKKDKVQRMTAYRKGGELPNKFTYQAKNYLSTSIFYGVSGYLGTMKWMKVSSKVPTWHDVNMDNAWNIKYHAELDSDYFTRNFPDLDEQGLAQEEEKFKTALSNYLSGMENVGKTLVTKFIWDSVNGREMATVKITPIKNETNHEAYIPLFQQSNSAICSGMRVSPAIAPIDTGNALSNADKYVEFDVHSTINTMRARMKVLEPFKIIWEANKWDKNIKLGFRNKVLQRSNTNPSNPKPNEAKPNNLV